MTISGLQLSLTPTYFNILTIEKNVTTKLNIIKTINHLSIDGLYGFVKIHENKANDHYGTNSRSFI